MVKLKKLAKASGIAVKDTLAVTLIAQGVQLIQSGDYVTGGALVVIGWALFVLDRYVL